MLEPPEFVFMQDYVRLFLDDDIFLLAIKNTLIFAGITGPVSYLLSLLFAWFINELPGKLRAIMTVVFYAPSISGGVLSIWTYIFSGDRLGILNSFLVRFGFIDAPIQWLTDPDYMMTCCIIVQLWLSLGTSFLSFMAGFKTVDTTLYEAGAIDGVKNRFQEVWFLTLPQMKPQLLFGAVMQISKAFAIGAVPAALCGNPSVNYATHTIMNHIDDYGGVRYELRYACAISTVLLMVMLIVNKVINKVLAED